MSNLSKTKFVKILQKFDQGQLQKEDHDSVIQLSKLNLIYKITSIPIALSTGYFFPADLLVQTMPELVQVFVGTLTWGTLNVAQNQYFYHQIDKISGKYEDLADIKEEDVDLKYSTKNQEKEKKPEKKSCSSGSCGPKVKMCQGCTPSLAEELARIETLEEERRKKEK